MELPRSAETFPGPEGLDELPCSGRHHRQQLEWKSFPTEDESGTAVGTRDDTAGDNDDAMEQQSLDDGNRAARDFGHIASSTTPLLATLSHRAGPHDVPATSCGRSHSVGS
uniref:Uncharacterized protein n=1 Tax=Noctiluca scintillans TaxID=2966 RepID=A0A7S1A030_NOCSC